MLCVGYLRGLGDTTDKNMNKNAPRGETCVQTAMCARARQVIPSVGERSRQAHNALEQHDFVHTARGSRAPGPQGARDKRRREVDGRRRADAIKPFAPFFSGLARRSRELSEKPLDLIRNAEPSRTEEQKAGTSMMGASRLVRTDSRAWVARRVLPRCGLRSHILR